VDVLHAIRKIAHENVRDHAVRGQYDAGAVKGKDIPAYRDEEGVAKDSATETFAAAKIFCG